MLARPSPVAAILSSPTTRAWRIALRRFVRLRCFAAASILVSLVAIRTALFTSRFQAHGCSENHRPRTRGGWRTPRQAPPVDAGGATESEGNPPYRRRVAAGTAGRDSFR